MSIKRELSNLRDADLWSILLFALTRLKNDAEYSALSELAYVLDRKNMLRLCEYFGGQTIRIPTADELEYLIYGMLLYQYVDIEHQSFEGALNSIAQQSKFENKFEKKELKKFYQTLKETLSSYEFETRSSI